MISDDILVVAVSVEPVDDAVEIRWLWWRWWWSNGIAGGATFLACAVDLEFQGILEKFRDILKITVSSCFKIVLFFFFLESTVYWLLVFFKIKFHVAKLIKNIGTHTLLVRENTTSFSGIKKKKSRNKNMGKSGLVNGLFTRWFFLNKLNTDCSFRCSYVTVGVYLENVIC